MRKNVIFLYVASLFAGIVILCSMVFAAGFLSYPSSTLGSINYYRPANSGATEPWQNINAWWRTFGNESFDILTPEYCKRISQVGNTNIFIPTRSVAEWNNFKGRVSPLGIAISSCISGTGCDIASSPIGLCFGGGVTFSNECETIQAWYIVPAASVCACNPLSGPVSAAQNCGWKVNCTLGISCSIFTNECAAIAAWASYDSTCGGQI